jgi:hypothetical protein
MTGKHSERTAPGHYAWGQITRFSKVVTNQFMLAMLLHQIAFLKENDEDLPTFPLRRHEVGLLYKYYMTQIAKMELIHGDRSNVITAVKARIHEEAALVEGVDPALKLALMETDMMSESCATLESRLYVWTETWLN